MLSCKDLSPGSLGVLRAKARSSTPRALANPAGLFAFFPGAPTVFEPIDLQTLCRRDSQCIDEGERLLINSRGVKGARAGAHQKTFSLSNDTLNVTESPVLGNLKCLDVDCYNRESISRTPYKELISCGREAPN